MNNDKQASKEGQFTPVPCQFNFLSIPLYVCMICTYKKEGGIQLFFISAEVISSYNHPGVEICQDR